MLPQCATPLRHHVALAPVGSLLPPHRRTHPSQFRPHSRCDTPTTPSTTAATFSRSRYFPTSVHLELFFSCLPCPRNRCLSTCPSFFHVLRRAFQLVLIATILKSVQRRINKNKLVLYTKWNHLLLSRMMEPLISENVWNPQLRCGLHKMVEPLVT